MPLFSTQNNFLSTIDNQSASGILNLTNTTDSTDVSSGALVVSGGLGIALSTHIGGDTQIENWKKKSLLASDLADFVDFVILLHPLYDSTANININYCLGTFFLTRGNAEALSLLASLKVNSQSAYQDNNANLVVDLANDGISTILFDLVTCTYQSIEWMAVRCSGITSLFGNTSDYSFEGLHKVSAGEDYALQVIGYYNSNTSTVVDAEINSSIAPFTANVTKIISSDLIFSCPSAVPSSSNAEGAAGEIRWDENYIYLCTAPNNWKRASILSW